MSYSKIRFNYGARNITGFTFAGPAHPLLYDCDTNVGAMRFLCITLKEGVGTYFEMQRPFLIHCTDSYLDCYNRKADLKLHKVVFGKARTSIAKNFETHVW